MVDVAGSGRTGVLTRLGLLAVGAAGLFALLYVVTVRTVPGRQLGDASLRGALSTSPAVEGTVDAVLNVVSIATLLGAVAVVAVIALVRLARDLGIAAIGILVAANLSALVLKDYLLTRPDVGLDEIAPSTLNSLPSGHSTAAFSAVAALVFVLPAGWRAWVATAGATYAAVTGVATMAAGWHRAADSMTAFLLVGFWTAVAALAVAAYASPEAVGSASAPARAADRWEPPVRWLVTVTVGCLAPGVAIALVLAVAAPVRESAFGSWAAFFAAALLITGTVTGVAIGLLRTLDLMDSAPAA